MKREKSKYKTLENGLQFKTSWFFLPNTIEPILFPIDSLILIFYLVYGKTNILSSGILLKIYIIF